MPQAGPQGARHPRAAGQAALGLPGTLRLRAGSAAHVHLQAWGVRRQAGSAQTGLWRNVHAICLPSERVLHEQMRERMIAGLKVNTHQSEDVLPVIQLAAALFLQAVCCAEPGRLSPQQNKPIKVALPAELRSYSR